VRAYATLGETSDAMRRVFGEYRRSNQVKLGVERTLARRV
jgi:hypothetical protein